MKHPSARLAAGLAADLAVCLALFGAVRCARETGCAAGSQPWPMLVIGLLVAVLAGIAGGARV